MVGPGDVARAAEAVAGFARETPVLPAKRLSRQVGGELWLKLAHVQVTGSFKVRGAVNRLREMRGEVSQLEAQSETERVARVVAASAGNHAQAVAWAARRLSLLATWYMPA